MHHYSELQLRMQELWIHNNDYCWNARTLLWKTVREMCHDPSIICVNDSLYVAGITMENVSGTKTSVFTGSFSTDWTHLAYRDGEQCSTTTALGIQPSVNANRVSWFFNLLGTSANIDTACSSSLVCLDMGCKGLWSGQEDMVSQIQHEMQV